MKIVEIVGTYGAVLSTIVAYRQWQATRPAIVITAMPAFNSAGNDPEGRFVRVVIANRGGSKIHVRHAFLVLLMDWATWRGRLKGLLLRRGRWRSSEQLSLALPEGAVARPALPYSLEAGQSVVLWIPHDQYDRFRYGPRVAGIQVAIQDETDQTYYSPPLRRFGIQALPSDNLPSG